MSPRSPAVPLISTKLHRPSVAPDVVFRNQLCHRLNEGRHLPLTLVSAPAGYGKSTLLGQWLDTLDEPSCWFSIDESDNDPRVFLSYLIAAARTVYPDACKGAFALLKGQEIPPVPVLLAQLTNDLDALPGRLVLALDDYHYIRNPVIHQILSGLLNHPPAPLHLAILSRRDPPIPVASLRGRHLLTEVRARDLQFTREESETFLKRATGREIDESAVDLLHAGTEGWPVGLRLAALALRYRKEERAFVEELGKGGAHLQQYLVEEILTHQPPAMAACLCEASILDRFCASVIEEVCSPPTLEGEGGGRGADFLRMMKEGGLPCVALDEEGRWYRHHHLFQELLRRRLREIRTPAEISRLHLRASAWFEEEGLLEEAVEQALRGGDDVEAGRILVRRGRAIMHVEHWHRLENLMGRLKAGVLEGEVELLLLRAWTLDNRLRRSEAWQVVDRAEMVLQGWSGEAERAECFRGEIHALRSCQRLEEVQGDLAVEHAERALASLPPEYVSARGYSAITLALGRQITGQADRAHRVIHEALADERVPAGIQRARLMSALAWIQWLEGKIQPIKNGAKAYIDQGRRAGLAQSLDGGRLFLGAAQYQLNELVEAEEALSPLLSDHTLNTGTQAFLQGGFALACTFQATGRADKARETASRIEEGMFRIRNEAFLHHARAFNAELALRQGRIEEAVRWAKAYDPEPFRLIYRFYAPEITLAKVLIAEGTKESHSRAESYLSRLTLFLSRTHGKMFSIPSLALQALLLSRQGDEEIALALLERSVALAQPGGAVRVLADLDPEICRLLKRLHLDEDGTRYVDRVLAAFRTDAGSKPDSERLPAGVGALTRRQLEILELLARRWSNKEIAAQARVSAGTVKRHTEDIYRKLGVHGRREAVDKAVGLGILKDPG